MAHLVYLGWNCPQFGAKRSQLDPTGWCTHAGHGVWMDLGHRQFAITEVAIFYDIQTGEYRLTGKLRGVLTLDKRGDALSGTLTVEAIGPDGNLVFTLTQSLRVTRIKVEVD